MGRPALARILGGRRIAAGARMDDGLAPTLVAQSPEDDSADIPLNVEIVLRFSKPIRFPSAGASISLRENDGGWSTVETWDVTDGGVVGASMGQIRTEGARLFIRPTAFLTPGREYAIRLDDHVVEDFFGRGQTGVSDDEAISFVAGVEYLVDSRATFAAALVHAAGGSDRVYTPVGAISRIVVAAIWGQSNSMHPAPHDGGTTHPDGVGQIDLTPVVRDIPAAFPGLAHGGGLASTDMGFDLAFSEAWLATNPDACLVFAPGGQGSTPIEDFEQGDALHEDLQARINALLAQNPRWTYGFTLWHQGESNVSEAAEGPYVAGAYDPKLDRLIRNFHGGIAGAGPTTPFIAGELARADAESSGFNPGLRTLPDRVGHSAVASAFDLGTTDGNHFSAVGLRTLGARYAATLATVEADQSAPTLVATSPANGSSGNAPGDVVMLTFSETIASPQDEDLQIFVRTDTGAGFVSQEKFSLADGTGDAGGSCAITGDRAVTLTLAEALPANASVALRWHHGAVEDVAGNKIVGVFGDASWAWTTGDDAVDLTASGGSLAFPENNWANTGYAAQEAFAYQAVDDTLDGLFDDTNSALVAIVRFDRSKRNENRQFPIMGTAYPSAGASFYLSYFGTNYFSFGLQGRFRARIADASGNSAIVDSPVWDEDGALVVVRRVGLDVACDWYSLADGARHVGDAVAMAAFTGIPDVRSPIAIGYNDDVTSVAEMPRPEGVWAGEIAFLGHYKGDALTDTNIQNIVAGVAIESETTPANWQWARAYDNENLTLSRPAWATGDGSVPIAKVGAGFRRGSNLLPQSAADYVVLDPLPIGVVYGCLVGRPNAEVPVSGRASSDVDVRMVDAKTGAVVLNWTPVSASSGAFSTTVTVPQYGDWLVMQARLQSDHGVIADMRNEFGVNWRVDIFGQSQLEIGLGASDLGDEIDSGDALKVSILTSKRLSSTVANLGPKLFRVGALPVSDGAVWLTKQWLAYGDGGPLLVVVHAEGGTSALAMINDSDSDRDWADVEAALAFCGDQATAVMWQWATSDNDASDYAHVLDAAFDGVADGVDVLAENIDHYFDDGTYQPGFGRIIQPAMRATSTAPGPFDTDDDGGQYGPSRDEQIAWASAHDATVGPFMNDLEIVATGGPHQVQATGEANHRFGARVAQAIARHVGIDPSEDPEVASVRFTDGTRTAIDVTFTLPNGGVLTAATATAITGFEVGPSGSTVASHAASGGFAAEIVNASGGVVRLAKASGSWNASDVVTYMAGGPLNYGADGPTEAMLLAGVLFETYDLDFLGLGVPAASSQTEHAVEAA